MNLKTIKNARNMLHPTMPALFAHAQKPDAQKARRTPTVFRYKQCKNANNRISN